MNSVSTFGDSQRKAARVAGFTFLFAMAIVVIASYSITYRLVVSDNAVETAKNIMAHETLFRLNLACNLIYVMSVVVLLAALYVILEPVNRNLALVATICRLVFALLWCVDTLSMLDALRFLGSATYLPVFNAEQLQTLARLRINSDAYYVALPFWGLASTVCSYLLFKSRYIPRTLAIFGVFASAWCVICAFVFIVFPHFKETVNAYWFDMPLAIFEMALGFWLLFKGLRPAGLDKSENRVQAGVAGSSGGA